MSGSAPMCSYWPIIFSLLQHPMNEMMLDWKQKSKGQKNSVSRFKLRFNYLDPSSDGTISAHPMDVQNALGMAAISVVD